ncbi:ABC transporter substrate-binding protein [Halococcus saccharolyticus]|uniref:Family 5 extracellular solute-binding protein n=1 Tax=Halococcus saccharolyticus DSM 5350 TaxID=1227455 RepID=M0MJW6_9EURY|nr:ABC transporter substrate-binding protein [Halococcus saccharolyticus]EMA44999.1 family 5 extracellular solute-binding protein [Halococcus saccharolyticus DSM 5350]
MTDEKSTYDVTRRRLLQGTGAIGIAGLAGCQSATAPEGGNGSGNGSGGGGGNGSAGENGSANESGGSGGGGGGQLTFAQVKSPIEFDPIVLNDVPSDQVASLVFDPLYRWNEAGKEIVPQIAAKQPEVENGGQRYVVPLNENATFHNGDPVTAEDVAYTFTAPVEEETENAANFNMIDTAEAVDEKTVQFDLKYPFGAFNSYLAANVVPKSVREEDKQAFNTKNPVGAGPFSFEGWQEGDFARVKRWDDYWGDPMPNLAGIEFVPVEEGTTRVTTLKSGENDVIEEIPPKSWSTVENMGNASIDAVPGVGYFYLAFNCKKGPTADPKVREAIDYVVSMDQAVSNFVEPTGLRQYSPLPKVLVDDWDMPIEEWKKIPHDKDVDKAKSMLDDSDNVPDNWNAKIIVPPDDKREQIGTSVANGLKEAGYGATVQRLDWGTFLERYVTGEPDDYNMYTLGWSGTPDPDSFMYFLFAQSQAGVGQGHFYQNEEVNSAIVDARESTDRNERKELYQQAITTLLEDRVNLPAYNLKNSFGVKNYVEDFTSHPVGSFSIATSYNNVSVEK